MTADSQRAYELRIGKNERGIWSVFLDDQCISTHASRDGAVASYRNLARAMGEDVQANPAPLRVNGGALS